MATEKSTITITIEMSLPPPSQTIPPSSVPSSSSSTPSSALSSSSASASASRKQLSNPSINYTFLPQSSKPVIKDSTHPLKTPPTNASEEEKADFIQCGDGWEEIEIDLPLSSYPETDTETDGTKEDDDAIKIPPPPTPPVKDAKGKIDRKKQAEYDKLFHQYTLDYPIASTSTLTLASVQPGTVQKRFRHTKSYNVVLEEKGVLEFGRSPFIMFALADDEGKYLWVTSFDVSCFLGCDSHGHVVSQTWSDTDTDTNVGSSRSSSSSSLTVAGVVVPYLSISVKTSNSLLTDAKLIKRLIPLQVSIRNVKGLPGLTITSKRQAKYITNSVNKDDGDGDDHENAIDKYTAINETCEGVHVVVRVGKCGRVGRTVCLKGKEEVGFGYLGVWFLGVDSNSDEDAVISGKKDSKNKNADKEKEKEEHNKRLRIIESIQRDEITINVHDRNPLKVPSAEYYEALVNFNADQHASKRANANANAHGKTGSGRDVDAVVLNELQRGYERERDEFTHGVGVIGMGGLLDLSYAKIQGFEALKSKEKESGGDGNGRKKKSLDKKDMDSSSSSASSSSVHIPHIKTRVQITPSKRLLTPKHGLNLHSFSPLSLLLLNPGNYLNHVSTPIIEEDALVNGCNGDSCTVGVEVKLIGGAIVDLDIDTDSDAGINANVNANAKRPFARAVYTFEYTDHLLLQQLNSSIARINSLALPDIYGSLMSYELTSSEVHNANTGELDVVCGFTVIDDDCRMFFIEGSPSSITQITSDVKANVKDQANDSTFRLLHDDNVTFGERMYTAFNVAVKNVRLRLPLPYLIELPEIYNRKKVNVTCFDALQNLSSIRRANRMSEVACLFPSAAGIGGVERVYGESVSVEDMQGVKVQIKVRSWMTNKADAAALNAADCEGDKGKEAAAAVRLKGPTIHKNPDFEVHLNTRHAPDYIALQNTQSNTAKQAFLTTSTARKLQDASELDSDGKNERFMYSSQRLAYTEIKKGELRDRLSKAKNCTFTYSEQYTSQTVCMVDAERLKHVQDSEMKAKMMTKRGFVYPASRKPGEYNVHPDKPSQSRIDTLDSEWVENEMHPQNVKRTFDFKVGQKDFNTVPTNGKTVFGGFEKPGFERVVNSRLIGSSKRLPRGKINEVVNKDFFTSVHMCEGEAMQLEMTALKLSEAEEWDSKVIVDSLDFHVGGFLQKEKTHVMDRTEDILKGKAKAKSIRIVRNAHLPSGRPAFLRKVPYSIFSGEQFKDPKDFTSDLRDDDKTKFLAKSMKGDGSEEGVDFYKYVNEGTGKKKYRFGVQKKIEGL